MLHFLLMRFVYDLKTYERKKSKSAIVFPTVLDMGRFVEGGGEVGEGGGRRRVIDGEYGLVLFLCEVAEGDGG